MVASRPAPGPDAVESLRRPRALRPPEPGTYAGEICLAGSGNRRHVRPCFTQKGKSAVGRHRHHVGIRPPRPGPPAAVRRVGREPLNTVCTAAPSHPVVETAPSTADRGVVASRRLAGLRRRGRALPPGPVRSGATPPVPHEHRPGTADFSQTRTVCRRATATPARITRPGHPAEAHPVRYHPNGAGKREIKSLVRAPLSGPHLSELRPQCHKGLTGRHTPPNAASTAPNRAH